MTEPAPRANKDRPGLDIVNFTRGTTDLCIRRVAPLGTLLGEFCGHDVAPPEVAGMPGDVKLSIGQCISFGIILNELVANAHKHAFVGGQRGTISVKIGEESEAGDQVHLIVSDNGRGAPDGFEFGDAASTGSRLVRGLTQQLRGEIWVERLPRGTAIHVRFPAAE